MSQAKFGKAIIYFGLNLQSITMWSRDLLAERSKALV